MDKSECEHMVKHLINVSRLSDKLRFVAKAKQSSRAKERKKADKLERQLRPVIARYAHELWFSDEIELADCLRNGIKMLEKGNYNKAEGNFEEARNCAEISLEEARGYAQNWKETDLGF